MPEDRIYPIVIRVTISYTEGLRRVTVGTDKSQRIKHPQIGYIAVYITIVATALKHCNRDWPYVIICRNPAGISISKKAGIIWGNISETSRIVRIMIKLVSIRSDPAIGGYINGPF